MISRRRSRQKLNILCSLSATASAVTNSNGNDDNSGGNRRCFSATERKLVDWSIGLVRILATYNF